MSPNASTPRSIEVERTIAGSPDQLWALVSDVTRMGEWSPETTGGVWARRVTGPAVGARFKGRNHAGRRSWTTACVVTACEPGKRFAFDVSAAMGLKVARWSYEFEPVEGGCRVVERWDDQRGALVTLVGPMVTGTKDRVERNRETMTATLAKLAAAVERREGA